MKLSDEFKACVLSDNLLRTKIILKDSLVVDPTFREFDDMIEFAENQIDDLYDEHDGEELIYDQNRWTKDYMDSQMVNLIDNFSKERLSLLKKICASLYSNKITKGKQSSKVNSHKSTKTKKSAAKGLTFGGAAVSLLGITVSKPAIFAVGAAATVIGSIMIITEESGR